MPGLRTEREFLRLSIGMTFVVAAIGILFGLSSGSFAIVFDGVYSLTDASMTIVALLVANLIAASTATDPARGRLVEHFTMGFWHLEPMVLGLNGVMLTGAAIYAFINAVGSLLTGGRELEFDRAIVYALVTLAVTSGMAVLAFRANRALRSGFVALDAKAWVMSALLTAALLVAFLFGLAIEGTGLAWAAPYVDPAVLALIALAIIPIPLGTIRQALADVLLVTPADLKSHVDEVGRDTALRHGFLSFRAYVARVGRGRQIELYFIVGEDAPARKLQEWDAIRDEVGEAIGGKGPDRWLTIAFTTRPEWAE